MYEEPSPSLLKTTAKTLRSKEDKQDRSYATFGFWVGGAAVGIYEKYQSCKAQANVDSSSAQAAPAKAQNP